MGKLAELFVAITGDARPFNATADKVKRSLTTIDRTKASPSVNLTGVGPEVAAAKRQLLSLKRDRIDVPVDIDRDNSLRGRLAQVKRKISTGLGGKEVGQRAGRGFGAGFAVAAAAALASAAIYRGLQSAVGFMKDANAEALESQKVGRTTTSIIRSTGGAAKITAGQVGALSTAISNKTGVDDEAIQSGSNLLLTFKNVRNEVGAGNAIFNRATAAAVDLSKAGFGSITGASKMLGKALNDPLKGISALSRAGVTFTQQQKDQIKALVESGHTLEAQKIIMREVESQVGGVAAATATAGEKMKVAWANAKEAVGTAFLPVLGRAQNAMRTKLLPLIIDHLVPALSQVARGFSVGLDVVMSFGRIAAGVMKPFIQALTSGKSATGSLVDFLEAHQADAVSFFVAMGHAVIGLGKVLAALAIGGIFAFRVLNKAVNAGLVGILHAAAAVAEALGQHGVAKSLDDMAAHAEAKSAAMDASMRGAATGIREKLLPALTAADAGLTKIGKNEINKAKLRDAAASVAQAIRDIGTKADGSQLRIKKWTDVSKLGADQQKALKDRIQEAHDRLGDQIKRMRDAGAGQDSLTKAWKTGKDRLFDEFKQMGLSNEAARKLADRYAGIKPKVETKFTAPGLTTVSEDTRTLDKRIRNINNRNALLKIDVKTNAGTVARTLGMSTANLLQKFAGGGTFGVLPGYTPGRDVHTFFSPTGGELKMSGGEGIMRPEWVKAIGGPAGVKQQNMLARRGKLQRAELAQGGTWLANIRIPGIERGAEPIPKTFANRANQIGFNAAKRWAGTVGRALQQTLQAGLEKKRAAAAAAAGGGDGGFTGPVGRGAAGIIKLARSFHPSYIAGHRDPQGGPAFDIGSSGAKNTNIGNALRSHHGPLGLRYVIRQMQITSARNGWRGWRAYHPITGSGDFRHVGHVHVSYVNGGVMPTKGLSGGGIVAGGRGGVDTRIGEGRFDELVTPLPKGWSSSSQADPIDRLIALLEKRDSGDVNITFQTYNPIQEAQSVTTNKALQRVAELGLV